MSGTRTFSAYATARWPRLVRSAILLGCPPSEAEDIAQAALERCFVNWSKVEAAQDQDAYVHRVLINVYISTRRHRRWSRETSLADVPEALSADTTDHVDRADAIMRCLQRLSTEQRTAVVLRYYAHLSEGQMVEVLGVPAGTIKSRLSRALRALSIDPDLVEVRRMP